ncbi:MAG: hypothetical protein ACKVPX_02615 [Myxococcaceae bacterium]
MDELGLLTPLNHVVEYYRRALSEASTLELVLAAAGTLGALAGMSARVQDGVARGAALAGRLLTAPSRRREARAWAAGLPRFADNRPELAEVRRLYTQRRDNAWTQWKSRVTTLEFAKHSAPVAAEREHAEVLASLSIESRQKLESCLEQARGRLQQLCASVGLDVTLTYPVLLMRAPASVGGVFSMGFPKGHDSFVRIPVGSVVADTPERLSQRIAHELIHAELGKNVVKMVTPVRHGAFRKVPAMPQDAVSEQKGLSLRSLRRGSRSKSYAAASLRGDEALTEFLSCLACQVTPESDYDDDARRWLTFYRALPEHRRGELVLAALHAKLRGGFGPLLRFLEGPIEALQPPSREVRQRVWRRLIALELG